MPLMLYLPARHGSHTPCQVLTRAKASDVFHMPQCPLACSSTPREAQTLPTGQEQPLQCPMGSGTPGGHQIPYAKHLSAGRLILIHCDTPCQPGAGPGTHAHTSAGCVARGSPASACVPMPAATSALWTDWRGSREKAVIN